MSADSYLTFSLNHNLYGISTVYVEEIFYLPELTPITDRTGEIAGILNLRGEIIPVMDLNPCLGYQSPDYRLTDSVVILKDQERQGGIIVNEVYELRTLSPDQITTELPQEQELTGIISGIARTTETIFILSNPRNWLREETVNLEFPVTPKPKFCPNATPEEQAIFRQRADQLKRSGEDQDLKSLKLLAIITLNDQYFGIDLELVREFTDIRQVTPVPCCPAHIIGNMNLRGDILTIVDIRGVLNLPLREISDTSKAMVVEVEELVIGVIVEEVCDVMFFLNPLEIRPVPTGNHALNPKYLQGVAPYHQKMMGILDLAKICLDGGLIVDEAI